MEKVFRLLTRQRTFLNKSYNSRLTNKFLIKYNKNLFCTNLKDSQEEINEDSPINKSHTQIKINREFYITVIISTSPFYLTTLYLIGSSLIIPDVSYLTDSSRYAVKALILNQTLWSGVNLGLISNELQKRNSFIKYDDFRLFINYASPIFSLLVGWLFLIPLEVTLNKVHFSFLMFVLSNRFQKWVDKKIILSSNSPLEMKKTKDIISDLNLVFIVLLYLFIVFKIDVFNRKKSKLNIDELKTIYENNDLDFARAVEINENLIDFNEISHE